MTDSQDPGLQDSLRHQKETLVGVCSAALGPEVEVEVGEQVPSELPGKQKIKNRLGKNGNKDIKWHQEGTNQQGIERWGALLWSCFLTAEYAWILNGTGRPTNCFSPSK